MLIVDSQVHVWNVDHPEAIPRHGDRPLRADDVLAEMRAARVDRAILVPPYWMGSDNSIALAAAQLHPDRFAVMGRFDLAATPDPKRVAGWRSQPGMLGIRFTMHTPDMKPYIATDTADWFWAAAESDGIPIMFHVPNDLAGVARVAAAYPKLRLAIDHMAIGTTAKDDGAFLHIDTLVALARYPNVSVKLSTVPAYSAGPYPYRKLHPYLRRLFDAYGPRRLFWGSDLSRLPCSYRLAVDLFLEELDWLTVSDLDWIMGRAVCEWSGWVLSSR
ncbi:MAG: amidohydrolase family protein [Burkholderiales bacterium]